MDDRNEAYWLEVIAKGLASFSLQSADMRTKSTTDKAKFLLGLGLTYEDAANLLGSTEGSIRELVRVSNKAKKGTKNGKRKKKP